jgi:hypothetical protein
MRRTTFKAGPGKNGHLDSKTRHTKFTLYDLCAKIQRIAHNFTCVWLLVDLLADIESGLLPPQRMPSGEKTLYQQIRPDRHPPPQEFSPVFPPYSLHPNISR